MDIFLVEVVVNVDRPFSLAETLSMIAKNKEEGFIEEIFFFELFDEEAEGVIRIGESLQEAAVRGGEGRIDGEIPTGGRLPRMVVGNGEKREEKRIFLFFHPGCAVLEKSLIGDAPARCLMGRSGEIFFSNDRLKSMGPKKGIGPIKDGIAPLHQRGVVAIFF